MTVVQRLKALTQIDDNFANNFMNTKARIMFFKVLKSTYLGLQKYKTLALRDSEVKSRPEALQLFKVDPVLKIDTTFQSSLDLCESNPVILNF